MKFACSNCSQHIDVENDWVGMQVTCPTCGIAIIVPAPKEAAASLNPPPPVLTNIVSPKPTSSASAASPDSGAGEKIRKDGSANPESKPTGSPSATTSGFTKHAFISHSSKDHETAKRICEVLESHGVNCWIAPRDIDPGAPYDEEILRGLASSQTFVLLLSDSANASPHVKRELMCALNAGHAVYPIRIQEVQPGPKLEYLLQGIHWVDAWTPPIEAHLDRLAKLIMTGHSPNVENTSHTTEPTQPQKRKSRVGVSLALVMVVVAGIWVAHNWNEETISNIASSVTKQVNTQLSGLQIISPSPSSPSSSAPLDQAKKAGSILNQTKKATQVNQTVTLCWAEDTNGDKHYSSSEQIFNEAGDILGELQLTRGPNRRVEENAAGLGKQAYLDFTGATGKVRLCVFRVDDPTGQRRVGKTDSLFFSGQLIGVKSNNDGHIGTITIQVTASSSAQIISEHAGAVALPNETSAAQVRTQHGQIVAPVNNQAQAVSHVNQTATLSWAFDPKVDKKYPSSEQILDDTGEVLGEVSIKSGEGGWGGVFVTTVINFRGQKETTKICEFRFDDPVGQTRVGKAEGVSISGRITELKRGNSGNILTITVQVTAKRPVAGSTNLSPIADAQNATDEQAQQPEAATPVSVHKNKNGHNPAPVTQKLPSAPDVPVDTAVTEANATRTALVADPLNQTLLRQLRQRADNLTDADVKARCLAAYALGCQLTGNAKEAASTRDRLNTQAAGASYVRLLSADNLSESCAACQGRGAFMQSCASCGGSGRCAFCKGSGRVQFQLSQTTSSCPNCKDGGCRTCGGKGQADTGRCLACNGQGKKVTTDRIRVVYLELLRS